MANTMGLMLGGSEAEADRTKLRTVRLQIDATPERVAEMDRLMELCGVATRKELLNNALTLLDWAVTEFARGSAIVSVDEGTDRIRELQMPILSNARANRQHAAAPMKAQASAYHD